jgi:hypothetical protein
LRHYAGVLFKTLGASRDLAGWQHETTQLRVSLCVSSAASTWHAPVKTLTGCLETISDLERGGSAALASACCVIETYRCSSLRMSSWRHEAASGVNAKQRRLAYTGAFSAGAAGRALAPERQQEHGVRGARERRPQRRCTAASGAKSLSPLF